jgi:IclR family acetate operon transcriptional repressor
VGEEIPVHATAVGRLYLAFAARELAFDDAQLEPFTAKTPKTQSALDDAVARARERGWDVNDQQWIAGLKVVAVPLIACGKMIGSLAVAAPAAAAIMGDPAALAERLLVAGERIGARLHGERA